MTTTESAVLGTTRAYEQAVTRLLFEFDGMEPRQARKLRRHHSALRVALREVSMARQAFHDATFTESQLRLRAEQERDDSLVACIKDDTEDGTWTVYPEVSEFVASSGSNEFLQLFATGIDGSRVLVRALPCWQVAEIRNVPRDHPLALAAREYTLANQGQPSWSEELASAEMQARFDDLADGDPRLRELIVQYTSEIGELPSLDWIEDAKKQLTLVDDVNNSLNA